MDQLTSRQISEWEAYDRLDPIGEWREDFRGAKLESLIVNIVQQLYAKKGVTPTMTTPIDFMPDWSGEGRVEEPKKQSAEQIKEAMLNLTRMQSKSKEGVRRTPPVKKTNKK